jgi:hypothetical protein
MKKFSINQIRQTVLAVIESNGQAETIRVFERNGLEITHVRVCPSGAVLFDCINDHCQRFGAGGYIGPVIVDRHISFSI